MKKNIVFFVLLVIALLPFGNKSAAQTNSKTKVIEVLNADNITYDKKLKDAQRLIGNVAFKHEGVFMYCDSALLFSKESRFQAYGHIHVKQGDSLNMFGDSLHYRAKEKHCKIWGNIRMIEKDMQLVTDSIQFNVKENKAWYNGGAVITSTKSGNKLTSKKGVYHSKSKQMFFSEDVKLEGEELNLDADTLEFITSTEIAVFHGPTVIRTKDMTSYCEKGWFKTKEEDAFLHKNTFVHSKEHLIYGDTISFKQKSGDGFALGNIRLKDTLNDLIISGGKSNFNLNEHYYEVTRTPLLTKILEKDTLFIYGDTMQAKQDTLNNKSWLRVFHRVKYFKTDLQGKCDSIYYSEEDSLMYMLGNPIVWSEGHQMTADTVKVKMIDNKIEEAWLIGSCFLVSKADTVGFNQVKGKLIHAIFKDEKIQKAIVTGNGQTNYYAGEKDKETQEIKKYKGMNHTDCSDIIIYFNQEDIDRITFITKPDSVFYPMDKINPKTKFLKDFRWITEGRPQNKNDIFPSK